MVETACSGRSHILIKEREIKKININKIKMTGIVDREGDVLLNIEGKKAIWKEFIEDLHDPSRQCRNLCVD